jgi:Family of unknown function (DUF6522)
MIVPAPVRFEDGGMNVDASIVAEGLSISPELLLERMREGRITSLCEKGEGQDSGRFRLSFFSEHCRFSLIVDESGKIVRRSAIDFGARPLPASAHKPKG